MFAVVAATSLLAGAFAAPLSYAEDLKDKKHQVEKKIDGAHQDLDESSEQLKAATAQLLLAQQQLATAQVELSRARGELAAAEELDRQMQAKLDAAVRRLADAQAKLADGEQHVEEQNDLLQRIVISNYQDGDPDLMGLSSVLTTQDPSELTGQLSSAQAVMDKESMVFDRLRATKVLLTVHQRDVAAAKTEVAKQRKAAAENLLRTQALEMQAEAAEQQVSQMVTLRAQARAAALQAKKSDLKMVAKLQVERDRIAELIRQQASRGAGYRGPVDGNGFLDFPTEGPITSPYGWRIHPIWGYRSLHDGIDIGAGCGQPIRAAASGKVLQEYYHSIWGNRLVIDHGVHFGVGVATIYNHLSRYEVGPGERVKRGDVIAYVGTTGWSTGCHLHFTVLENGVPNDPMRWF